MNQYSTVGATVRSFDDDGNLIDDGTKQYLWDAENRLLSVKQGATTLAEFEYDYQSRRISKTANGSNVIFVYDGWNPIAEYVDGTLAKTYTWGMDLSGSMQGAGGVGGLLAVSEFDTQNSTFNTFFPTYDGNGNISEYLDASGAVVAHYEYDAFGRTVVQSGAMANDFSHQFSTKQRDAETGLHYYGYRYYDSSNGRWLARDPIEESGGLNVYVFVGNSPINHIDILGLRCLSDEEKKLIEEMEKLLEDGKVPDDMKDDFKKVIDDLKSGIKNSDSPANDPPELKTALEALKRTFTPNKAQSDAYSCSKEASCSQFTRAVLRAAGQEQKTTATANAAAFANNRDDANFKSAYGTDIKSTVVPSGSKVGDIAKMGDVVAGGNLGSNGTNAGHVGISLGNGLMTSHHPKPPGNGGIEIRGNNSSGAAHGVSVRHSNRLHTYYNNVTTSTPK